MGEPAWMTLAKAEIGTLEVKGSKHNPKIVGYFKDACHGEIKDDETAWCAAFVGAMLRRVGVEPNNKLGARTYETWGERLDAPVYGCVGVKKRAGGQGWQGHVGFVVAANPTTVWMLGGNQSDSVSIAPFSRWQFTAFRWPEGVPQSDVKLPTTAPGKAGSEA